MSDVLLIVFVVVCVAAVALILLDLGLRLMLGNETDEEAEEELHGNPMSRMNSAAKKRRGGDMPTEMPGVRRETAPIPKAKDERPLQP